MKTKFKVGDSFSFTCGQEHINDSDPCNKDNCMVNRAGLAWFQDQYGPRNFKMKSTNHGLTFVLDGRKYIAVFDHKTAHRIYNYDQCFRDTRSKEKARAGQKPFKVRMIIESSAAVSKGPAMSEEIKAKLKSMPRKKAAHPYVPKSTGVRRQLSL